MSRGSTLTRRILWYILGGLTLGLVLGLVLAKNLVDSIAKTNNSIALHVPWLQILLIVVIAFFPVAIDMQAGLQSVDPAFVALMRSVGASKGKILLRVQIPHSLPHLMAGLKVAITFSVIGAIVGEFAGAKEDQDNQQYH